MKCVWLLALSAVTVSAVCPKPNLHENTNDETNTNTQLITDYPSSLPIYNPPQFPTVYKIICSKTSGTACLPNVDVDVQITFDVTQLHHNKSTNVTDYQLCDVNNYNWFANVAGLTNRPCQNSGIPGVVIMENWLNWQECFILATDFTSFSLIDPSNAQTGIALQYGGGDASGCPSARTVVINILCSATLQTLNAGPISSSSPCDFLFEMSSPLGCPSILYPPQDDATTGISGGTVFIIVLLVAIFVYLVGGASYNYYHGLRGWALLPHREQWLMVFLFFVDGCRFSYLSLLRLCDRSTSSSSSDNVNTIAPYKALDVKDSYGYDGYADGHDHKQDDAQPSSSSLSTTSTSTASSTRNQRLNSYGAVDPPSSLPRAQGGGPQPYE